MSFSAFEICKRYVKLIFFCQRFRGKKILKIIYFWTKYRDDLPEWMGFRPPSLHVKSCSATSSILSKVNTPKFIQGWCAVYQKPNNIPETGQDTTEVITEDQ